LALPAQKLFFDVFDGPDPGDPSIQAITASCNGNIEFQSSQNVTTSALNNITLAAATGNVSASAAGNLTLTAMDKTEITSIDCVIATGTTPQPTGSPYFEIVDAVNGASFKCLRPASSNGTDAVRMEGFGIFDMTGDLQFDETERLIA
jgi:hypothetical protein